MIPTCIKKEIPAAIPSAVDKEKAVIPEDSGANEEYTTELIQATWTSEITTDDDERARKEPKENEDSLQTQVTEENFSKIDANTNNINHVKEIPSVNKPNSLHETVEKGNEVRYQKRLWNRSKGRRATRSLF